jgi:hypothetical protein
MLLLLQLGLRRLGARDSLLDLGFAHCELPRGCELALVRLDLVLERLAERPLARQRALELAAQRCHLRRLVHERLRHEREHVAQGQDLGRLLGHGRHVLQLGCLLHPELARQLSAEARAEPGLDLVRHLKWR